MQRPFVASLCLIAATSACNAVVLDSQEGGSTSTLPGHGGGGATSGSGGTTVSTETQDGGTAGSGTTSSSSNSSDTGTTTSDTGTTTTDTGTTTSSSSTSSDTGTTTSDTGTTTTDTGTTSSTVILDGLLCPADEVDAASGAVLAATAFPNLGLYQLVIDPLGNPIVSGIFTGQITLGGTVLTQIGPVNAFLPDVFVAKLDPCGEILWATSFGSAGEDGPLGLDVDLAGDVYLLSAEPANMPQNPPQNQAPGRVRKLSFDGAVLWERDLANLAVNGPRSLSAVPGGGAVIAGWSSGDILLGAATFPDHPGDTFVARLDADGNVVWTDWLPIPGNHYLTTQAVSQTGEVFVATQYSYGLSVTKLDAGGSPAWTYDAPGGGFDGWTFTTAADPMGDLLIGGRYFFQPDFGVPTPDAQGTGAGFLLKLSGNDGVPTWADFLVPGAPTSQMWNQAISPGPDGTIGVAGTYHGVYDFAGQATMPDVGVTQLYSAKVEADGTLTWIARSAGPGVDLQFGGMAVGPDGRTWIATTFKGALFLPDGTQFAPNDYTPVVLRLAP